MLMIKGGHGSFLRHEYPPSVGLGCLGHTSLPTVAYGDPKAWPGWSPRGTSSMLLSRKVTTNGPRVQGWAPCRSYTRAVATQSVEGMNAGLRAWGPNDFDLSGAWEGVPSWVLTQCDLFGLYLPNQSRTVSAPQDLLDQAQTEMLVKLADRKVHLGNALAESGKTIAMIAQRTLSVLTAYRAIRRGKFRAAATALGIRWNGKRKSAASLWLEWQYGWKPLLSDIYGGAELLRKGFRTSPIVRVARKVERTTEQPGPVPDSRYTGSCTIKVISIGFYKVDDHFTANLSSLGLVNPLEIAWELTPFSFVLDWFIPVGDFLTALTASTGMTFVDGCFSMQARGDFAVATNGYGIAGGHTPVKTNLTVFNKGFAFRRIPFTVPPRGHLYMKPVFSSTRVVNALALLTQLKR